MYVPDVIISFRLLLEGLAIMNYLTLSFHVAISMLLPPNIYAFTAQYLCFYRPISMLLPPNIYAFTIAPSKPPSYPPWGRIG